MDTTLAKRALARILGPRKRDPIRRVILTYHAVGQGPFAIPRERFQAQMEWLARRASVLTLDDLLRRFSVDPLQVAITFDDGYSSVVECAESVMTALGFPGTVYVNTGWMGREERIESDSTRGHYPDERFMTWSDLERLRRVDWTVGSHGVEHDDLTRMPPKKVASELRNSRLSIEDNLGSSCVHFAYTWGRSNPRVRRAVAEAGYQTAATTIHGPVPRLSDPFTLPRVDVSFRYGLGDFEAALLGDWDYLGPIQRLRGVVRSLRPSIGEAI